MLLVRVGAMGDVLHALPALAALRAAKPDLPVDWVVASRWAPLLVRPDGAGPLVARIHIAETRLWSRAPLSGATLRSVLALRHELRQGHYGTAVDVQGTLRSAVLGRFAGAAALAGFADPREAPAASLYRQRFERHGTHVVEQNAALLGEAFGLRLEPLRRFPLPHDAEAEAWAEGLVGGAGSPVAMLAPTAGWGAKQWPGERFGELARQLREAGVRVLVNAASGADAAARAVAEGSGGSAELAACSVAQLIALTRRLSLMVGGDSGPVHLAAALGVPCVALYGPTDPARNGPWGDGAVRVLRHPASITSYKRSAGPDLGLAQMGVAEVRGAALDVLSAARENR